MEARTLAIGATDCSNFETPICTKGLEGRKVAKSLSSHVPTLNMSRNENKKKIFRSTVKS